MSNAAEKIQPAFDRLDALLPRFAGNAAAHDQTDAFVAENFAALKSARLMSAAVPAELGGDGLGMAELSRLLRRIAPSCASTALAFAMHTHVLAALVVRIRRMHPHPSENSHHNSNGWWIDRAGGREPSVCADPLAWRRRHQKAPVDAVEGFASGSLTASWRWTSTERRHCAQAT